MAHPPLPLHQSLPRDLIAGTVVFLVALPLCLGIALASGATPFSGLLTGIIGGLVVGFLSGSQTSVSGPAAGLTAIVSVQIASLGNFQTFLLALVLAGIIQLALGMQVSRTVQEPLRQAGTSRTLFSSHGYAIKPFSRLQPLHPADCQTPDEKVLVAEQFR